MSAYLSKSRSRSRSPENPRIHYGCYERIHKRRNRSSEAVRSLLVENQARAGRRGEAIATFGSAV
jgi:hypothetical protein